MAASIGVDFGTSNSTAGYSDSRGPQLLPLEDGKTTIPSAIFYDTEDHRTLFGRKAIAAYIDHGEGRLLRALKSVLGSNLIEDTTQVGARRISFKSIIGEFIGHLKATAEAKLERPVENAVLGRPVWFIDGDAEADLAAQTQLEAAARTNGFKHIQFQYEPIAAALDYEQTVAREELALIADIGGGTSDFSIIRVSPERRGKADRKSDILGNTGVHVGGTDLDRGLSVGQVMRLFGHRTPQRVRPELELPSSYYFDLATWHKIVFLYNRKFLNSLKEIRHIAMHPDLVDRLIRLVKDRNGHRLAGDVEAAKIALSEADTASFELGYVETGLGVSVERTRFEADIAYETNKIARCIEDCVTQAGVAPEMIDTIVLTGGTTSVPAVFNLCRRIAPNARLVESNKLGSVGTGLAIDAALKFGPVAQRLTTNAPGTNN